MHGMQKQARPRRKKKGGRACVCEYGSMVDTMKHVLLVQFRTKPRECEAEQARFARLFPTGIVLHTLNMSDILQGTVSLRDTVRFHDAIIFGGSAELYLDGGRNESDPARTQSRTLLDSVAPLLESVLTNDTPFLGICYGHQLFAEYCGGTVANDTQQEKVGTHTVARTEAGRADPVFQNLPDVFYAQYGHKDSVTNHPREAIVLASSPTCSFAALRYGTNAYTMQFHPELSARDMHNRLAQLPEYVPDVSILGGTLHESPEAARIVRLFCEKVVG